MKLQDALKEHQTIVENGPLGTRLSFNYPTITTQAEKEAALTTLYQDDIAVAQKSGTAIIVNACTYRASANHMSGKSLAEVKEENIASVSLIKQIATKPQYANNNPPIILGAPLGSMYDAYSIDKFPTAEVAQEYHAMQIRALKATNADFLNVVTIPSLEEAIGISAAAEAADMDYTIGFILDPETGKLRDGTPLKTAIQVIDQARTTKLPIGYLITCTHASVINKLTETGLTYPRLIGIQPNGSALMPEELAKLTAPIADTPETFATDALGLKEKLGLTIIGGCCGTDRSHLTQLVADLDAKKKVPPIAEGERAPLLADDGDGEAPSGCRCC